MKKAIKAFKEIETEQDLRKNKITLAEYHDLSTILQNIINTKSAETILKGVADWCKRKGLNVQEQSICFKITV